MNGKFGKIERQLNELFYGCAPFKMMSIFMKSIDHPNCMRLFAVYDTCMISSTPKKAIIRFRVIPRGVELGREQRAQQNNLHMHAGEPANPTSMEGTRGHQQVPGHE